MSEQNNSGNPRRAVPRLNTRDLPAGEQQADRHAHAPPSHAHAPHVDEELAPEPQSARYRKHHHHHTRRRNRHGPKWHKDYSEIDTYAGRVLIIDFIKQDASKKGIRKVSAQEIYDLQALRKVYTNPERNDEAVLRVFHVQNAEWATNFLLRKFNIDNRDGLVGTDFGKYVRHKRPERRGGKPFLTGKTWKVQYDPWRGISKTSFGVDYLKQYRLPNTSIRHERDEDLKMLELNCFNEEDNPCHGFDVYVQRVSCYIQHKQDSFEPPADPDISNPYNMEESFHTEDDQFHKPPEKKKDEYIPRLDSLDNGNSILIFDNSHSGCLDDTLIPPRQTWEERWRRLPFFLAFESRDMVATDEELAYQGSRVILEDIFRVLADETESFLDQAMDHVSILEDRIYEQPADETRAPELWLNSSLWLKVEKLVFIHIDIVKEMGVRLRELTDDMESDESWLDNIPVEFERLAKVVTEDLIKPTENLISLLYQSVSIRDSRHSIQLDVSMWRLSWITFIFLPLSFITGVFGMNVDIFEENPSLKWYFIVSVPFMFMIMVGWYVLKHLLASGRQTPHQRGIYEHFFNDMATENPSLWSRGGPRGYITPKGRLAKIKWRLIKSWSAPEKTIHSDRQNNDDDDLGTVSQIKRFLIRRWTSQIAKDESPDQAAALSLEAGDYFHDDGGSEVEPSVVTEGLVGATELLVIPATPAVEGVFELPEPETRAAGVPLGRRLSFHRHRKSSSSNRNSGILVEEEDWNWLSERGKSGKQWAWRTSSSRERDGHESGAEGRSTRRHDADGRSGSHSSGANEGKNTHGDETVPETTHDTGTLHP